MINNVKYNVHYIVLYHYSQANRFSGSLRIYTNRWRRTL